MPVWKKYISKSSLSWWILSSVLYLVLGVPFFINTQLHSFCLSTRAKKKILQKVNLTKYYNVIVVCVQMCTYLCGECLRLTVQVYRAGYWPGPGLWLRLPRPSVSGSESSQPRAHHSSPVQSGEAFQREKIHYPPVISVVVLLLLLLLFFLLPLPITNKCQISPSFIIVTLTVKNPLKCEMLKREKST